MVFSGIDIVLDRTLDADQIRRGIADVLSVEPDRVSVIDNVAEYPERGSADVVNVVTPVSGDFAAVVSINCEPLTLPFADVLDVVEQLSASLKIKILVPFDGPDPYLMWLIQPDLPRKLVGLDVDALAADSYEIRSIE